MSSARRWSIFAGLLLLTIVAYAPGLHGEFVLDDRFTVETNFEIRHLGHYLDPGVWLRILRSDRVFTEFTFAFDYAVGKLDPFPYHATNLAIHLGVVLLVYAFVRRMLDLGGLAEGRQLALAVAAVFALHPLQTEAVIYVSQRAESLASGLYLGALLLVLAAERRGRTWVGAVLYLAALGVFILGLGTKSIVLTMPLAYVLIGLLPGRALYAEKLAPLAKRILLAAPFVLCSLLVVLRTVPTFQGRNRGLNTAGFDIPSLPPWRYLLTEWHVMVVYLRLLFWPADQNLDWDFPLARGPGDPTAWLCGLLLTVLLLGAGYIFMRFRTRDDRAGSVARVAVFGLFWYFLVLALTSSIIPILDVLVEHRLYLACVGLFLAVLAPVGLALRRLPETKQWRLTPALPLLLCAGLAAMTYHRTRAWQSMLRLWTDAVAKSPHKARPHAGLGGALCLKGQLSPAIDEYVTALGLAGDEPVWIRSRIYEKLTTAYLAQGRTDEAIAAVQKGLQEDPESSPLLGVLAIAYLRGHQLQEAKAAAEHAVRTTTSPATALLVLGLAQAELGDQTSAVEAFERALALEPDLWKGRLYLAALYRAQGRMEEACSVLRVLRQSVPEQLTDDVKWALASCPAN
jgi:Flp pilus assembly protein TadD